VSDAVVGVNTGKNQLLALLLKGQINGKEREVLKRKKGM
jgi:hypothetical protein